MQGAFGRNGPPVDYEAALEAEYVHLYGSRPEAGVGPAAADRSARLKAIYRAVHARNQSALCLSGGGVRSASFAVGILQGLAARGLLSSFDYLSTVSGGGYTGAWLSAWLVHATEQGYAPEDVFRTLGGAEASALKPEPEPLRRIRDNSRYLDPKIGLFSADVWTLVATIARNLLLNWLVLLPLLAAALLVPRLYFALLGLGAMEWLPYASVAWWANALGWVGIGLVGLSLGYIVLDVPSGGNRRWPQSAFLAFCFAPLCVATALFTLHWAWSRELDPTPLRLGGIVGLGVGLHTSVWVVAGLAGRRRFRPIVWAAAAVSGAVAGATVWWLATYPFANPLARGALYASTGVPLMLATLGGAGTLFVGLASGDSGDEDREWWSRFGAWLLIGVFGWLLPSAVVFLGPVVAGGAIDWLSQTVHATPVTAKALIGFVTAITGGLAAATGREPRQTPGVTARRVAFLLAAPTFVVLLLVLLASMNVALLAKLDQLALLPEYVHPAGAGLPEVAALCGALILLGVLMGFFVAVNKFSLHGMYRNRLIRAFLGASRPRSERRPNRFTGFDSRDNVYMCELRKFRRPLHVVNMALNLVSDSRLAWQERKAESFTVTPLHAGASGLGYRPVEAYGGSDGMSLGTAMTVSGAAASPNMGFHSSPAVTFILTLFNARLGAWLGNPGPAGAASWRNSDPLVGAGPLVREMFGRTTDRNPYVFLSDGGHFENLGLYEMVARRCRYIVVSDAGCDADYAFDDLGNAIRKIRIDLGIPIVFPEGVHIGARVDGRRNHHAAIGSIRYSAVDGGVPDGVLVYIKATLSGDEPIDVMNYATSHPTFPHETTANQWFGEAQFESYRALGVHTVDTIAGSYDGTAGLAGLVVAIQQRLESHGEVAPPAVERRLPV